MTKREDGRWVETMVFTVNGRKQRKYFYGATKREVLDKIAIFESEREQGRYWQEVIDEWWEKYQPTLAYNSVRNTAPAYQRARLCFEGKRMKQITPSMVKTALDKLVAKNHMAKKTASTQLGVFRLAFRYAVLCDDVTESPAREVMIPEGLEHTRRELPSRHDVQIIAGTQGKGGMAELYAFMALYTGLRQGELLGLTWDDINIADRLIYIRRSVYSKDGKGYAKEPKTQAGIRIVPILDELLPALNAKEKKSGKLFSSDGEWMGEPEFKRLWRSFAKEYELTCTSHQLRHELATLLLENNVPIETARVVLGHADTQTTERVYQHIRDAHIKEKIQQIKHLKI